MTSLQRKYRCSLAKLLLFLTILTSGNADCPKPQGKYDIVLTNESLLKNAFPEGSEATFECANGYVRDDGSGTVTCTTGKWSEPDLSCRKRDCGPLRILPNMSYNISHGTLFGAKVKVSCDEGYYLLGSSFKQCYSTGWSGRTKCEAVRCDMPSEIANGTYDWQSTELPKYGDVINYTCDEGCTLIGNTSIECNKKGDYSSPPPLCKENTDIYTVEDITGLRHTPSTSPTFTTTRAISTTPSLKRETGPHEVDKNEVKPGINTGHKAVAASVISTVIVVLILLYVIHRCLLKRKGSYYTGEDLSRESLQLKKHEHYLPK